MTVNLRPQPVPCHDSTTWWWNLAKNRLLDVCAVLIALISVVDITRTLPSRATRNDFACYYAGSRLIVEGQNPYRTSMRDLYQRYNFAEPDHPPPVTDTPTFLWLFVPLAMLPARTAFWTWVAVQVASLGAVLYLTCRALLPTLTPRGRGLGCIAVLGSQWVYWHFYFSQLQLVLAVLVLGGYVVHRKGRHTAACLAVTTAGLLKLFPFVLLPWFIWRSGGGISSKLRRVLLMLVFGIGMLFVTGVKLWGDFWLHARKMLQEWAIGPTYFNFCLSSFITSLARITHAAAPSTEAIRIWWLVGATAGLLLIGLVYALVISKGHDCDAEFCLLCIAMLVGSVMAWGYYFVLLIYPAAVAFGRVAADPTTKRVLGLVTVLLLLNCLDPRTPQDWSLPLKVTINYMPLYGLLGLGSFFVGQLKRTSG